LPGARGTVYASLRKMSEAQEASETLTPRVEALLERMTLVEKAGQMTQHSWGVGSEEDARGEIAAGLVGSVLNARSLEERNGLQRLALQSRLAIPLIFGRDVIHGYKTIFPISLALAASFEPLLAEQTARAAAREATEVGVDWTFAPMIDVARDPRWGRVAESFGEDPLLTSAMGAGMVRGFQGRPGDTERVAACAKHFAGYGATESGKEYNTTWIPEPLLRDVHLPPFRACVQAGVMTLMTGFNDLNGVPASGNAWLLRRVLKGQWQFPGFVVSDWASMAEMIQHGLCADEADVARVAALAGVDLEMASRAYVKQLPRLVETGVVPVAVLDEAVRRILRVKEELGLFDEPFRKRPQVTVAVCPEHLSLAQAAAERSVVLLKNEGAVLPLGNHPALAVLGPLADAPVEQLGSWSYDAEVSAAVTPLSALRARLGEGARLEHVAGLPDCRSSDTRGIQAAEEAARRADVVLLFLGEPANISGECRSRAFLDLPGAQAELLRRVAAVGRPVVLIVQAGRPLCIGEACSQARAVLYAGHLGTMTGPALANLLFGDVSPSGKLPISFPRTVGQVPVYYAHKNTGRPPKTDRKGIPTGTPLDPVDFDASYLDVEVTPEFPFGFGLSYASFEYGPVELTPPRATREDTIRIRVSLRNSGSVTADEVAQLYVRDLVGSLTRPVRELKDFQRVTLAPGESKTLEFTLTAQALAFCGADMVEQAEPGKFQIFVGGDSRAPLCAELELV
jgi:beta-glucosidase